MGTIEIQKSEEHELSLKILKTLRIEEKNVAWVELRMCWTENPIITVKFKYYPDPISVNADGDGIVSVLKECKLTTPD